MDGMNSPALPENYVREVIFILFKRLRLIAVTVVLVGVAATAVALYWPPVYGAFGSVLVKGRRLDKDPGRLEQADVRSFPLSETDLQSEVSIITSDGLLGETLNEFAKQGRDDILASLDGDPEKRIDRLKSAITARVVPTSNVIEVTLSGGDPAVTLDILRTMFGIYPGFRERIYNTTSIGDFLDGQVQRLRQELVRKNDEATAFLERAGLTSADQQIAANLGQQRDLETLLLTLETSIADLDGEIRYLDDLLASPDVARFASVRLADGTSLGGRPEIAARIQQQHARLAVAQSNAQRVREHIRDLTETNLALRRNQLTYQVMERELAVLGQAYQTLLTRHNEALINGPQGDGGSPYVSALVAPRSLSAPLFPNQKITIAVGMVAGVLLGVSLAFIREFLDRTFARPEDVQRILGVPTLFSIPDGLPKDAASGQSWSDGGMAARRPWRRRAVQLVFALALLGGTAGWMARGTLPPILASLPLTWIVVAPPAQSADAPIPVAPPLKEDLER